MAIDTREKRQSAAWLVSGFGPPSVTPNISKDGEWRQQAGWGYSGIAAGEAVAESPLDNTDPPITGGGRTFRKGEFPEWWKEEEEPQPAESPQPKKSTTELIAEAAAELDTPRSQLPLPEVPSASPKLRVLRDVEHQGEAAMQHAAVAKWKIEPFSDPQWLDRRQRRRIAALLLLKLLR